MKGERLHLRFSLSRGVGRLLHFLRRVVFHLYLLELNLFKHALAILCEPLAKHEAAESVVVRQDHDALHELGNTPAMTVLGTVALEQPLQMVRRNGPWLERHDLIQLAEPGQTRLNFCQTFRDPGQITALQHELLLQNVQQVVTLVAADCHDRQVKLMLTGHDIRVGIRALPNNFVCRVRVVLNVLGEPAKDALVRPNPPILVKEVIKD